MRFPFITAICVFMLFLAIGYTSCDKTNTKPTTRIKCVTCANGGLCIDDTCRCPPGYEGNACLTQTRQKYMGSWNVLEKGTTTPSQHYSISIQTNSSNIAINSMSIYYLYDYGFSTFVTLDAFVSTDSILIPRQRVSSQYIVGRGYLVAGTGFSSSKIRMRYMVTDTTTGITNDFGYNSAVDSPSVWTR